MMGAVDPLWDRIWVVRGHFLSLDSFPVALLNSLPSFLIPLWKSEHSLGFAPDILPSQGCSCSAPLRIHILGPGHKSWLSTQSFPKSPCPEPALLHGWDLIKSPFTMSSQAGKMGIKSALLLLLQWLRPVVPARRHFWDSFPTLGVNAGVTLGGTCQCQGGNAESASKTPEKAIPAGGLSIKCGGWVKEAKLLLAKGQGRCFLVKKPRDCSSWRKHQG